MNHEEKTRRLVVDILSSCSGVSLGLDKKTSNLFRDRNEKSKHRLDVRGFNEVLAVNAAQEVYVGGYYSGTVDFDPGPGNAPLSATGTTDGFV
ncbi:MAG: hypothetical protein D4S02_01790, partial [Rhodocyclaceae bacterium]